MTELIAVTLLVVTILDLLATGENVAYPESLCDQQLHAMKVYGSGEQFFYSEDHNMFQENSLLHSLCHQRCILQKYFNALH